MSARRWNRLAALIRKDEVPRVAIGACVEVSMDRDALVLRRMSVSGTSAPVAASVEEPIALILPGLTVVPWAGCGIEVLIDPDRNTSCDELVDFSRLSGALCVRAPMPGDRFMPLGMGGRSMPLADFFRGRGVPRDRRALTPLVCDQLGIIWVAGHRISDRIKETEQTRRFLSLRLLVDPR